MSPSMADSGRRAGGGRVAAWQPEPACRWRPCPDGGAALRFRRRSGQRGRERPPQPLRPPPAAAAARPTRPAHRLGALGQRLEREADVLEGLVLGRGGDDVGEGGDGEEGDGRGGAQRHAHERERGQADGAGDDAVNEDDEQAVLELLALGAKGQRHEALLDEAVEAEGEGYSHEIEAHAGVVHFEAQHRAERRGSLRALSKPASLRPGRSG